MVQTSDVKPIGMLDLQSEVAELRPEIEAAFARVLDSGAFIGGSEVEAFEAEVAQYLGVDHAIGLNSGTDALIIGLEALGIGPGDEVITTPFSFFATAEAILRVGATPVFADIDPVTFNIDPKTIEPLLTERTRALLPVHIFGLPAPMDELVDIAQRHDLRILEDAAQAFGACHRGKRVGAIGDVGAFSFYPTKTLGAYGDAGLLTTNDAEVAEKARRLRNHGSRVDEKYIHDFVGHNSRLDALQAAVLRVKLGRVEEWARKRRQIAGWYQELLGDAPAVVLPPLDGEHVFHQFTVQLPAERLDAVRDELTVAGIASQRFYAVPLNEQPALGGSQDTPPVTRRVSERVLSLPVHPYMVREDVERIASRLLKRLHG